MPDAAIPGSGLIAQYLGAVGDALRADTAVLTIADTCVFTAARARSFRLRQRRQRGHRLHFIEDVAKDPAPGPAPRPRHRAHRQRAVAHRLGQRHRLRQHLRRPARQPRRAGRPAAGNQRQWQLTKHHPRRGLCPRAAGPHHRSGRLREASCASGHQCLVVPSANMQHVEDVHLVVTHPRNYLKHALETVSDPNGKPSSHSRNSQPASVCALDRRLRGMLYYCRRIWGARGTPAGKGHNRSS